MSVCRRVPRWYVYTIIKWKCSEVTWFSPKIPPSQMDVSANSLLITLREPQFTSGSQLQIYPHTQSWLKLRWEELLSRELTYPPKHGILKMIFLFPRWAMLVPRRVWKPKSTKNTHIYIYISFKHQDLMNWTSNPVSDMSLGGMFSLTISPQNIAPSWISWRVKHPSGRYRRVSYRGGFCKADTWKKGS